MPSKCKHADSNFYVIHVKEYSIKKQRMKYFIPKHQIIKNHKLRKCISSIYNQDLIIEKKSNFNTDRRSNRSLSSKLIK